MVSMEGLKNFVSECIRVLRVLKKPSMTEYKVMVKASGLGMAVMGAIGFLLEMAKVAFLS